MPSSLTRMMPLLLGLLLGVLIWMLDRAAEPPAEQHMLSAALPDMVVQTAEMRHYGAQGQLLSVLTSPEARHLPQDDTMLFDSPRLEQSRPGEPKIIVTSESAKTLRRASDVWLYGNVEMRRAADAKNNELVVHTRDMWVDTQSQIVRSKSPVSAEMGSHRAKAVGFVANNRQQTLQLLSQVSMTYVPNKRTDNARIRVQP